ncbi:MAG: alpha/beta hydrolase [Spirochaetaceae bacterium]|nr:alpha/beta hydrolase [Spirochaetaceae bacterium]
MRKTPSPFLPIFSLLLACAFATVGCAAVPPTRFEALEIALEAGPLLTAKSPQTGAAVSRYLAFADSIDESYRFEGLRLVGTIPAGGYRMGAVLLLPPTGRVRGTILAYHGYRSHIGHTLNALERLADRGWAVIGADLPGHGFTDGPRGDVRDFSAYGQVSADIISWVEAQSRFDLPRPFILLGHSTGGSACLESLWRDAGAQGSAGAQGPVSPARINAAILLSPLIKPVGYWAAPAAFLLGPFVRNVRSIDPPGSYLDLGAMPLHWVRALVRWNDELPSRPVLDLPVLIVQGTKDDVVDWRRNIPFIKAKIPSTNIVYLEGRGHVVAVRGASRDESLSAISAFLDLLFGTPATAPRPEE